MAKGVEVRKADTVILPALPTVLAEDGKASPRVLHVRDKVRIEGVALTGQRGSQVSELSIVERLQVLEKGTRGRWT